MGLFSNLFKSSTYFESEYTDKTVMPLAQVISAHVNWKSRLNKFMEGTLGYNLDPEILREANATELGRWILQADSMGLSDAKKDMLKQLHLINVELHQIASRIAQNVQEGRRDEISSENEKFKNISKELMYLLLDMSKHSV
jgi:hypothetical protein